ncbi:hypothetical protein FisN_3Hh421 [Fistulifera solaris]|uniref:Kinesin light chain n=1 Tax=Fistulifera solaris TaxID=1519565 RepID=A0A1Z5K8C7_FISSO|nr:hypothetical protein FisN_3Hh421 [Fistulifera solaris]|eukprot:GAX22371.1 hypothetical protein FisN_3Hh421 [Fistulifera solaris]
MASAMRQHNAMYAAIGKANNPIYDYASSVEILIESLQRLSAVYFESDLNDEALYLLDAAYSLTKFPTAEVWSVALKLLQRSYGHYNSSDFPLKKPASNCLDDNDADLYLEDECDSGPIVLKKFVTPCASQCFSYPTVEASILFNKASTYHKLCKYSDAKSAYNLVRSWVHGMLASPIGPHTEVLMELGMRAENNIGFINYCEGEEEMALSSFQSALLFARSLCTLSTAYDLELADVLSNVCRVSWMSGKINQLLFDNLNEVLRIRSNLLNRDHPNVAATHYNLAMAEYARQCNTSALNHIFKYLHICSARSKAGYDDLDPVPGLIYLMLIQNDEKEDKGSIELARGLNSLQEKRQEFGPKSSEAASTLNYIGTVLFHQKDYQNSLLFFKEELRLEIDLADGAENISTSVTCNNIGRIYQEMGQYHDAIAYYHRSLRSEYGDIGRLSTCSKTAKKIKITARGRANASSSSSNLYSTVWYNLGLIQDKLAAYEEAIFAFEMSLELRRAMLGADHPDIACLLYNIGVLRMERQQLDEASACFSEALRVRRKGSSGQLNDRHVVTTLEKLSMSQKEKGNIIASLEIMHEVQTIQEQSPDYDGPMRKKSIGITLRTIAELHHILGDIEAAMNAAQKSVETLRLTLSDDVQDDAFDRNEHISTIEQVVCSLLMVGSLYHEMCNPLDARAVIGDAAQILAQGNNILYTPSLSALHEVTSMLTAYQSAPQA